MTAVRQGGGGGVQSVGRALALLETITQSAEQLGISDLARATDLPAATIHRLLGTLVSRGYVQRDAVSRKYAPGAALLLLDVSASRFFGPWVQRHLAQLVEASGETANVAVLDEHQVVYVAVAPSAHTMRMFTEVGRRAHAHTTAVGKVLLSLQARADVQRLVRRYGLAARTPNSITDEARLFSELDAIAAAGHGEDNEEDEIGVRCIAVPVFGGGKPLAALSISGPTSRLHPAHCERMLPKMHRVSSAISAELMDGVSRQNRPE